jgi:hypothetical protein
VTDMSVPGSTGTVTSSTSRHTSRKRWLRPAASSRDTRKNGSRKLARTTVPARAVRARLRGLYQRIRENQRPEANGVPRAAGEDSLGFWRNRTEPEVLQKRP